LLLTLAVALPSGIASAQEEKAAAPAPAGAAAAAAAPGAPGAGGAAAKPAGVARSAYILNPNQGARKADVVQARPPTVQFRTVTLGRQEPDKRALAVSPLYRDIAANDYPTREGSRFAPLHNFMHRVEPLNAESYDYHRTVAQTGKFRSSVPTHVPFTTVLGGDSPLSNEFTPLHNLLNRTQKLGGTTSLYEQSVAQTQKFSRRVPDQIPDRHFYTSPDANVPVKLYEPRLIDTKSFYYTGLALGPTGAPPLKEGGVPDESGIYVRPGSYYPGAEYRPDQKRPFYLGY
jgi:hypothetical protein